MTTFRKSLFSSVNASLEYNATRNIMDYNESQSDTLDNGFFIILIICLLICLAGLVGNGIVIWLLGFRIKRTPFTTYILNLAIADFAVLNNEIILDIGHLFNLFQYYFFDVFFSLFNDPIFVFTYSISLYLITIISIDRCVCLFFPLWHRCHRPPRLSTAVCVLLWILSFLIAAINVILRITRNFSLVSYLQVFFNAVVCLPIISVSTTAMFIKFCLRPSHKKKGKLFRIIWLTLFFFLLLAFPYNVIDVLSLYISLDWYFYDYAHISVILNSAINPMIYYLVGRDKTKSSSKQINKVLEKLFKEEEDCRENREI